MCVSVWFNFMFHEIHNPWLDNIHLPSSNHHLWFMIQIFSARSLPVSISEYVMWLNWHVRVDMWFLGMEGLSKKNTRTGNHYWNSIMLALLWCSVLFDHSDFRTILFHNRFFNWSFFPTYNSISHSPTLYFKCYTQVIVTFV